jgi:mycothiol synthase
MRTHDSPGARPGAACCTGSLDEMWRLEVLRQPDAIERADIEALVHGVQASTGRRPLSDGRWLELAAGTAIGVRASSDARTLAWAQFAPAGDGWTLEVAVAPDATCEPSDIASLVERCVDEIARSGGGQLRWWTVDERSAIAAAALGFDEERALHQMHVDLPLAEHTDIVTRAFEVGRDEAAWLEVNNAAFGWHPEQGGWNLDTLRAREQESWFDPAGFRLHERDGRLVAFCWTKVHRDLEPVTGEIYVIAVHPDAHGTGLGRALTLAGLQHIADGGVTQGMLYVDRDNTAAVSLYRRLGFRITRTDQAFVRTIATNLTAGSTT